MMQIKILCYPQYVYARLELLIILFILDNNKMCIKLFSIVLLPYKYLLLQFNIIIIYSTISKMPWNTTNIQLLLLLITITFCFQYRYLKNQTFYLTVDFIEQFDNDVVIVRIGNNVSLYNMTSNIFTQSHILQSGQSQPQFSTKLQMLLFKDSNSLYQMQVNNIRERNYAITNSQQFVGVGSAGQSVMLNRLQSVNTTYFTHASIYSKSTSLQSCSHSSGNIFGGTQVSAFSSQEAYFVSGAAQNVTYNMVTFFMYRASSSSIKLIQCSFKGLISNSTDQNWLLSVSQTIGQQQKYAISYHSTPETNPKSMTTYVVGEDPFNLQGLIGVDFLQNNLYTADNDLCRIISHIPPDYDHQYQTIYKYQNKIVQNIISEDEKYVLLLTNTTIAYLLDSKDSSGYITLKTTVYFDWGAIPTKGFMAYTKKELPLLILLTQKGQLYLLKSGSTSLETSSNYTDICFMSDTYLYSITTKGGISTLKSTTLDYNFNKIILFETKLDYEAKSLLCLSDNTVLVVPVNVGDQFQIWGYDNETAEGKLLARTVKLAGIHQEVYSTKWGIYFKNSENKTSLTFYDLKLNKINVKNQLMIASKQTYQILTSKSDDIFIAVGNNQGKMVQLDYYKLQNSQLNYKGSFSLNQYVLAKDVADLQTVFIFPGKQLITIDYLSKNSNILNQTFVFKFAQPTQHLQGHFVNSSLADCSNYTKAIFRIHPQTQQKQVYLLKMLPQSFAIEAHSFNGSRFSVSNDSFISKQFIGDPPEVKFSEDKALLLIGGVKYKPQFGKYRAVQIRSCDNLSQIVLQKNYSDMGPETKIRSHSLSVHTLFSTVSKVQGNKTWINIITTPLSDRKINIQMGNVSLFSVSRQGVLAAIISIESPNKIIIIQLTSQKILQNITTTCQISKLSLDNQVYSSISMPRGLAYLCSNGSLFAYYKGQHYPQGHFESVSGLLLKRAGYSFEYNFFIILTANGVVKSLPVQLISKQMGVYNHQNIEKAVVKQDNIKSVVINKKYGVYAYLASNQTALMFNFENELITNFSYKSSELTNIFFKDDNLAILTKDKTLIELTPSSCPQDQIIQNNYCVCIGPLIKANNTQDSCVCPGQLTRFGDKCGCLNKKYLFEENQCLDCSFLCERCIQSGLFNCQQLKVWLLVLIIAAILLIVFVIGCVVRRFWIRRAKNRKNDLLLNESDFVIDSANSENKQIKVDQ